MKDTDNNNGAGHLVHMRVSSAKHLGSGLWPVEKVLTGYDSILRLVKQGMITCQD